MLPPSCPRHTHDPQPASCHCRQACVFQNSMSEESCTTCSLGRGCFHPKDCSVRPGVERPRCRAVRGASAPRVCPPACGSRMCSFCKRRLVRSCRAGAGAGCGRDLGSPHGACPSPRAQASAAWGCAAHPLPCLPCGAAPGAVWCGRWRTGVGWERGEGALLCAPLRTKLSDRFMSAYTGVTRSYLHRDVFHLKRVAL